MHDVQFTDYLVETISLILLPVAVLMCAYALTVFIWRARAIAKKQVRTSRHPFPFSQELLPTLQLPIEILVLTALRFPVLVTCAESQDTREGIARSEA